MKVDILYNYSFTLSNTFKVALQRFRIRFGFDLVSNLFRIGFDSAAVVPRAKSPMIFI